MPLTQHDRRFLGTVDRFKVYLLGLAVAVFLFVLFTPPTELSLAASVIVTAFCALLWVTQRLLNLITLLDLELTKAVEVLKRTLPEEQRSRWLGH